eukprot:2325564-Pyramimonas_sp.AAC.1
MEGGRFSQYARADAQRTLALNIRLKCLQGFHVWKVVPFKLWVSLWHRTHSPEPFTAVPMFLMVDVPQVVHRH